MSSKIFFISCCCCLTNGPAHPIIRRTPTESPIDPHAARGPTEDPMERKKRAQCALGPIAFNDIWDWSNGGRVAGNHPASCFGYPLCTRSQYLWCFYAQSVILPVIMHPPTNVLPTPIMLRHRHSWRDCGPRGVCVLGQY